LAIDDFRLTIVSHTEAQRSQRQCLQDLQDNLARPEAKPNTASALRRGIELERRERERKIAVMSAIVGEDGICQ
jgi:hypothetical protein